tara:strand:- start:992 stop:1135 length:144 start_codon:yes stop_codon:yes gene_type:complete
MRCLTTPDAPSFESEQRIEIGMITLPIGMNVFVIKGVVGNSAPTTTV